MGHKSPLPWNVYGDTRIIDLKGRYVADVRYDEHTDELRQYIVTAANAFPELVAALQNLLERYIRLASSGDCGFWNPEEEPQVINARAALRKASESHG